MQSTTTGASNPYDSCMHSVGEWAQTYQFLTPEQRTTAVNAYNAINGIYLQTRSLSAVPAPQQPRQRGQQQQPQQPRQRGQRAAQQKTAAASKTTTPRVRTPAGQLGAVDAKVLDVINKNPGITTERLLGRAALRDENGKDMTPNILGTCISRLFGKSYITGTVKVGPFTATPAGVTALQQQPMSINTARANRQRRSRAATPAPTEQQQQAAAG